MSRFTSAIARRHGDAKERHAAFASHAMKIASIAIASMVFVGCVIDVEQDEPRVVLETGIITGMQAGGGPGPKSFDGTFEFNLGEDELPGYDLSPLNLFRFSATATEGTSGAISGSVFSDGVGFDFEGTFTIDDFEIGTFFSFDAAIIDATEPTLANAQAPMLSGFFLTVFSSAIDGEFTIDAVAVPEPSALSAQLCALGLLLALRRNRRSATAVPIAIARGQASNLSS
jgi:hypothetical protein